MNPIVLFDGECGMCDRLVTLLIHHDPGKKLRFAPLSSSAGIALLQQHNIDPAIDSVVFIDNDQAFIKSSAAIKIAMEIGEFGWLTGLAALIPRTIRDDVYDFIARHRHQWFPKKDHCEMPTADDRERFL